MGEATQAARVLRVWADLREWHSIEELAAAHGVTTRTVWRDLAVVRGFVELVTARGRVRRADAERADLTRIEAVAAERAACLGVATKVLNEVDGAAVKSPGSHAAGEASAARRIVTGIAARGES